MAVTDSRARVIGVNGLRVVDASTFPLLPPGHLKALFVSFHGNGRLQLRRTTANV